MNNIASEVPCPGHRDEKGNYETEFRIVLNLLYRNRKKICHAREKLHKYEL